MRIPGGVLPRHFSIKVRGKKERALHERHTISILIEQVTPGCFLGLHLVEIPGDATIDIACGNITRIVEVVINEGRREIQVIAKGIAVEGVIVAPVFEKADRSYANRSNDNKFIFQVAHEFAAIKRYVILVNLLHTVAF